MSTRISLKIINTFQGKHIFQVNALVYYYLRPSQRIIVSGHWALFPVDPENELRLNELENGIAVDGSSRI
jgi:hypothetical protein